MSDEEERIYPPFNELVIENNKKARIPKDCISIKGEILMLISSVETCFMDGSCKVGDLVENGRRLFIPLFAEIKSVDRKGGWMIVRPLKWWEYFNRYYGKIIFQRIKCLKKKR